MQAICSYCWLKHVKTLQEDGQELGGYFVWKQLENTECLSRHLISTKLLSTVLVQTGTVEQFHDLVLFLTTCLVKARWFSSWFSNSRAIDPHRIAKNELRMTRQISTTNFAKNMAAKKQHTSYTHTFSPQIFMDDSKNQSVQAIQPIQQLSRYKSWKRQAAAFRRSLVLLPQKQIPAPIINPSLGFKDLLDGLICLMDIFVLDNTKNRWLWYDSVDGCEIILWIFHGEHQK